MELYLKAFIVGVAFGVVYDGIRFFKLLCGVRYKPSASAGGGSRARAVLIYIVSFVTDTVFLTALGIASVLLFYNVSGGVFRASVYPCMLFGMALYHISIGRLTLALMERLVLLMRRILSFAKRLVAVPMNAAKKVIFNVYHLTIGRIVVKIKGRIKASREMREAARLPACDAREEERKDEDSGRPYKRYGRISF